MTGTTSTGSTDRPASEQTTGAAAAVMTRDRVEAAAAILADRVRVTPILVVDGGEFGIENGVTVTLKLEFLQHSGTFKGRGALHFLLVNEISPAGVTAASGGNHGVAVAWAAAKLGHRATIFVPTISAPSKVARLRALGAEVVQTGQVYADSLAACQEHEAASGATSIHAYDAADVVAGAGTAARELEHQVADAGLPQLDAVLVACGGGGLSAGVAGWFGARAEVVACETIGTAAWARAREAGRPVDVEVSGLAADSLGASRLGSIAFQTLSATGASSVVVDDDATASARQDLWDRFRLAVEASAAVPLAALRTGAWRPRNGSNIGVIVCGANSSPADLDGLKPDPSEESER